MTRPHRLLQAGAFLLLAQLALQIAWHGLIAPGSRAALALALLPLVPPLWMCLHQLARGVLVGALVGLFYFCHGVAELMRASALLPLALTEIALSVAVVAVLYLDVRAARRRAD